MSSPLASFFGQPFFRPSFIPLAFQSAFSFRSALSRSTCVRKARSVSKSGAAAATHSQLATILVLPALALGVRAGIDLNFESYAPLITAAVLFAGVIFAIFWRFDPQLRGDFNQCVSIALFALAYSYGVLAFADVMLDASPGHDTQTVIDRKRIHVSGGPKGSSVWYQVKVDPDASPPGANWIHVQPDLWESFHQGDTVCVHVGAGFFATRWYAVGHCAE
jgi:hypothetical protein